MMSYSVKKRAFLPECIAVVNRNNNNNSQTNIDRIKSTSSRSTRLSWNYTVLMMVLFSVNLALLIDTSGAMWPMDDDNSRQHSYYKNRELTLEDVLSQGEEKCINKPCVQSEQCCPGSVCVNMHPTGKRQVTGTCLPIYGVNEGDFCADDNDCEPGLHCLFNQLTPLSASSSSSSSSSNSANPSHQKQQQQMSSSEMLAAASSFLAGSGSASTLTKTCQPPGHEMMKKQYNDECQSSSECDSSRGLCCQLIKRHRMTPRRACLYFSDPKVCIGSVDVTFARPMPYSHFTPTEHDYFRARIG